MIASMIRTIANQSQLRKTTTSGLQGGVQQSRLAPSVLPPGGYLN
jgi:hypothetical protein